MLDTVKSGATINGLDVLIERRTDAKTKSGKDYVRFTLRDKTSAIESVFWNYDASRHNYPEGSVVLVDGKVSEYNGQLQLTIEALSSSSAQPEAFAKSTRFNVEAMWSDLQERVAGMTEPLTRFVAEDILLQPAFAALYQKSPAAMKIHHPWLGGLLEHVWSLCKNADGVVAHYQTFEPKISKDKVVFGLLLHDSGKVQEYDFSSPGVIKYTATGTLTPHIVMGCNWVYERANKWWERRSAETQITKEEFLDERAQLIHVIAAHHGALEHGSPVVPATLEAWLVHLLDIMDGKLMHAMTLINGKSGPIPGFSERSYFERTSYRQYPQP